MKTITSLCRRTGAVLFVLVLFSCLHPTASPASPADDLHWRAWDQCLDSAAILPAARLAFYVHRTVAVPHPEVYLQADELISDILENLPGSRLAYRSRDARDIEMYLRIARREMKGGAFGWGMMTVTPDSVYDARRIDEPRQWLDLRAPSAAVLLKSATERLSTFESALLRYNQLTRTGRFGDELFVVVDKDGRGYLASDTILWEAGFSDRPVKKPESVAPVLVFNRHAVFSALVDRDDRSADSALARVMARLGTPRKMSFDEADAARIERLKRVGALTDPMLARAARLHAAGLVDRGQPQVDSAWAAIGAAGDTVPSCATLTLLESLYWANRLSPWAAKLAVTAGADSLAASLPAVQTEYLQQAGRPVSPQDTANSAREAWGCLWSYDLIITTIDDIALTRAGSSYSQAAAMSAILDLAGLPSFQLSVRLGDKQIPDQEWVFAGEGRFQFNLGVWTTVPLSLPSGARPTVVLVSGFVARGRPVRIGLGAFCSALDDLGVGQEIGRIARQMPLASLMVQPPTGEVCSMQRFIAELTEGRHRSRHPVWPGATVP
jgi:hypothetical protein